MTLIRFLHDDLSAEEGTAVRLQIQSNTRLQQAARRIESIIRNAAVGYDAAGHSDLAPDEDVSAFVDQRMSHSEAVRFEQRCLSAPDLLREVVETWKTCRSAADIETRAREDAGSRVRWPLSRPPNQVSSTDLVPASFTAALSSAVARENLLADLCRAEMPPSEMCPNDLVAVVLPKPALLRPANRRRSSTLQSGMLLSAAVALLITAVVVFRVPAIRGWALRIAGNSSNPEPQNSAPGPPDDLRGQHQLAQSPDRSAAAAPGRNSDDGQQSEPLRPPLPPELPMVRPNDRNPPAPVVQTPGAPPGGSAPRETFLAVLESWTDHHGLIAIGQNKDAIWSGILSERAAAISRDAAPVHITTARHSRGTAQFTNAMSFTIDQSTSVDIQLRRTDLAAGAPQKSEADRTAAAGAQHTVTAPLEVHLTSGRFVIHDIPQQSGILVTTPEGRFLMMADSEATAAGASRLDGRLTFSVYRGSASVNGERLTRRNWMYQPLAAQDQSARVLLAADAPGDADDWFRRRSLADELPSELLVTANPSDDVVASVALLLESPHPSTVFHSAQVLLQYSHQTDRAAGAVPAAVLQLAQSGVEIQRQALVDGLTFRYRQDATAGSRLVNQLMNQLGVDTASVRMWNTIFQAAVDQNTPSIAQVQHLVVALRSTGPIMERQCAKYFLQQLLMDPLDEYDPAQPTNRQSLSSITRKVRAWQQANR